MVYNNFNNNKFKQMIYDWWHDCMRRSKTKSQREEKIWKYKLNVTGKK